MRLRDTPQRGLRKLKMDGVKSLTKEAVNLIVTDIFLYRTLYWRYLRQRLATVPREELRHHQSTTKYDDFNGSLRIKGSPGFRGETNPVHYDPGDRFVCELSDARILGPSGLCLTSDGHAILDTVTPPPISSIPSRRVGVTLSQSMTVNGLRPTLKALDGRVKSNDRFENVAVAIPPWNNYYHWTIECLPRFRLLEKHGKQKGCYPVILIPSDPPSWMQESIDILDYSGEVREWDGGFATADTLVVPTFPDPIPVEVSWLRRRMLRNANKSNSTTERIYIDRSDATVRRVANRNALGETLSKYEIDSYRLSELSVEEQLNLFSRAELVVAPHGAGLTNMVFAENASIVELFGDKTVATFDRLAEMSGRQYTYLQCEQRGVDIHVDTDQLDETLQNVLVNR